MTSSRFKRFDPLELERLLVCGEELTDSKGLVSIHYPSTRELAERCGVTHSTIARFAREHDCYHRRELLRTRLLNRVEYKITERRAQTLADARTHVLEAVDLLVLQFRQAIEQKTVRCESIADFNVLARLREFLAGGPDQRAELQNNLSLESLQTRYLQSMNLLHKTPTDDPLPAKPVLSVSETSSQLPPVTHAELTAAFEDEVRERVQQTPPAATVRISRGRRVS